MGPQREVRKVTDTDDLDAAMLAVSTAPPRGPVDRRGPLRRRWRQRVPAAPAAHLGRADGPRLVFEPGRIGRDRHPKMMRARFSWLLLTVALLLVVAGGNTPRNAVTAPHPTPHIPGGPNSGVAPVQSRPSKTRSRPLRGTSTWRLTNPAMAHEIEGYANVLGAGASGRLQLMVSTSARRFRAYAYRIGGYRGEGREIWSSRSVRGHQQRRPEVIGTPQLWSPAGRPPCRSRLEAGLQASTWSSLWRRRVTRPRFP